MSATVSGADGAVLHLGHALGFAREHLGGVDGVGQGRVVLQAAQVPLLDQVLKPAVGDVREQVLGQVLRVEDQLGIAGMPSFCI